MIDRIRQLLREVTHGPRRWVVVEADCREALPQLWASTVQLLLTDAPYGISKANAEITRSNGTKPLRQDFGTWDQLPLRDLGELIGDALRLASVPVDGNGAAYLCTSAELFGTVYDALISTFGAAQRGFLAWTKGNPAPSIRKSGWLSATELCVWGRRAGNPFNYPRAHSEAFNWIRCAPPSGMYRRHPTEKPLALLQRIIRAQTRPGDVVLDCFCGGGSTGEAALREGRRFIGIELDPRHAAAAHDHLLLVERAAEAAARGEPVEWPRSPRAVATPEDPSPPASATGDLFPPEGGA